MSEKATVAVIGCGGVAGYAHLPTLAGMDNVQLVGLCDIDGRKAQEKAERFGGRAYTDYQKMLDELRPQRVHVLTPEAVHAQPALAAFQGGADVLVEIPMADSVANCRAMVNGAAGRQLLGVDYNFRFIPVMQEAAQQLRGGAIGDLAGLTIFCHNFCWHHCLDLARWLAGPVVRVRAQQGRELAGGADARLRAFPTHQPQVMFGHPMVAGAHLEHNHGAVTYITTTSQMDLVDIMFDMRLIGTDGWLRVDQVAIEDVVGRLRKFPASYEATSVPPQSRGELVEFYPASTGGIQISYTSSIRAFHQAADNRTAPPADANYGLEIVAVEAAARKSADEGRAVALTEVR